jgi:hypothetical protein
VETVGSILGEFVGEAEGSVKEGLTLGVFEGETLGSLLEGDSEG